MSATICQQSRGEKLVARLEEKLDKLIQEIVSTEFFRDVVDPDGPSDFVHRFFRNMFLEIYQYQADCSEATFTAIGRMPKIEGETDLIQMMCALQVEEFDHGEMALRDYQILGGDLNAAKSTLRSPESLVATAVMRQLGEREHPFTYLGYMFLFERLTPIIIEKTGPALRAKGLREEAMGFLELHAEEDIRHSDMISNLIVDCAERFPDEAHFIEYGFDCFSKVYPQPIWNSVYLRAKEENNV